MMFKLKMGKYLLTAAMLPALFVLPAAAQLVYPDFELIASDRSEDDRFGTCVVIKNGLIAVTANGGDGVSAGTGTAYIFDAATGSELFRLVASDGQQYDYFGSAIDMNNGIVAIGAESDDDNGYGAGAVYLFDAATGMQLAKLLADDGLMDDSLGEYVAIDNGIVAAGARWASPIANSSGAVYLFNASTGAQIAKIVPGDGAANDQFGRDVALADGILAVGAPNNESSGSVYLYNASNGAFIRKIKANDADNGDYFGTSIAIYDGIIAVGASSDLQNGRNAGAAYLFDIDTGDQLFKIIPNDASREDYFGASLALDSGRLVVGAFQGSTGFIDSGAAYIFDSATGSQLAKLIPTSRADGDRFGQSVAIQNGIVVVGANLSDRAAIANSGAAYLYDIGINGPCIVDITSDGKVDFLDVTAFVQEFQDGSLVADFSGDGRLDYFDVSEFIAAFMAGCP